MYFIWWLFYYVLWECRSWPQFTWYTKNIFWNFTNRSLLLNFKISGIFFILTKNLFQTSLLPDFHLTHHTSKFTANHISPSLFKQTKNILFIYINENPQKIPFKNAHFFIFIILQLTKYKFVFQFRFSWLFFVYPFKLHC